MTRHKVEQMRDALVDRDKSQAVVTRAAVEIIAELKRSTLAKKIIEAIESDLGDLEAEALKVTR